MSGKQIILDRIDDLEKARENIMAGFESKDDILLKFGINDIDTAIYKLHLLIRNNHIKITKK